MNQTRLFVIFDDSLKAPVWNREIVVMSSDPRPWLERGTHYPRELSPPVKLFRIVNAVGLDRTKVSTLRQQKSEGFGTTKPLANILRNWADLPESVLPVLRPIKMRNMTQWDPKHESLIEVTEQRSGNIDQSFEVVIVDRVPVGVQWIRVSKLPGASPRVQRTRSQHTSISP
jgi:hypothetical protein